MKKFKTCSFLVFLLSSLGLVVLAQCGDLYYRAVPGGKEDFIIQHISGAASPAHSSTASSSYDSSSSIKILNWNIQKNGNEEDWIRDFLRISRSHRPDLILMQEALLNTGLEYALNRLEGMSWMGFSPNLIRGAEGGEELYSGVLIATTGTKLRLVEVDSLVSDEREPVTGTPKTTLMAKFEILSQDFESERTLLVVNVHGINFVSLETFKRQMSDVLGVVERHRRSCPTEPIILFSGDFNTWNDERLAFLSRQLHEKLRLTRVRFPRGEEGRIKSFLLSPPLDHIYYSDGQLEVVTDRADVLEEVSSSDHKPLFVEFKMIEGNGLVREPEKQPNGRKG